MRDTLLGLVIWGMIGCAAAILWLMWTLSAAYPAAYTAGAMILACLSFGMGGLRPRR